MAILPYQVEVIGEQQRDQVLVWCEHMWPHTKGATWYMVDTGQLRMTNMGIPNIEYEWIYLLSFQREEDLLLYQITWV